MNYRSFEFVVNGVPVPCNPVNYAAGKLTYVFVKGAGANYYRLEYNGNLVFGADDTSFILGQQNCEYIYFNAYNSVCSNDYTPVLEFAGKMRKIDMDVDLDACKISVKPLPSSIYDCIELNANTDVNIITLLPKTVQPVYDKDGAQTDVPYYFLLSDVIQALLIANGCSLNIVSDFFQFNPVNASNTNYVTGQTSKVMKLVLVQKSDFKRPTDSNPATRGIIKFNDLFQSLNSMFNVRYYVNPQSGLSGSLVIEHASQFQKTVQFDMTVIEGGKYIRGSKKYKYDTSALVNKETFSFMEANNADFVGVPIKYNGACVSDGELPHNADIITTDYDYVKANPDDTSDDGWMMLALDVNNKIIADVPVLTGVINNNNSLGFAQLHRDYQNYERLQPVGSMNNAQTNFLSVVKTRVQQAVSVPLCCGKNGAQIFAPDQLVLGTLGEGEVQSAEVSVATGMMKLVLLLGDAAPVNSCIAPTSLVSNVVDNGDGTGNVVLTWVEPAPTSGSYNLHISVNNQDEPYPVTGTTYSIPFNYSDYPNPVTINFWITQICAGNVESSPSNLVSVTLQENNNSCDAVTGLLAQISGSDSVDVSFTSNSSVGTEYDINLGDGSHGYAHQIFSPSPNTLVQYTFTGVANLGNGNVYTVDVLAICSNNLENNASTVVVSQDGICDQPSLEYGVASNGDGTATLTLYWTAPNTTGNYKVYIQHDSDALLVIPTTDLSYTNPNAAPGHYVIYVTQVCSDNTESSNFSNFSFDI